MKVPLVALLIFLILTAPNRAVAQPIPVKSISIEMADTLYFKGQWGKALDIYESQQPNAKISALTWMRMGYCHHNLGNYAEAIREYSMATKTSPSSQLKPFLESRLARSYAKMNNKNLALVWLDSATHSGYNNLQEMDSLTDYNSIRKEAKYKALYERAQANVYPCLANPKNREFDFWIGEWDVYQSGTTAPIVGHSLIQNVAGGCLILENWTSLPATQDGKSMNYYDPSTGKWEQVWMGSGGGLTKFINGEYRDGAMRFTFDAVQPNGSKAPGRFTFFNVGPNQVRQFNEQSLDGGKTWQPVYDLTYLRKK